MLAGGASRRMGATKALLEVDGEPIAARAARALRHGGAGSVVLVGATSEVGAALAMPVVADQQPGEGPLGGLASALGWARDLAAEVAVVVACDQPDLDAAVVRALVAAVRTAPPSVVAAVPIDHGGEAQPLPSAWRTTASSAVAGLVAAGERRLRRALDLGAVAVAVPTAALVDLDTPDDLAARLARGAPPTPVDCPDPAPDPRGAPLVDVPEIDIAEAAARVAAGTPVIDVREPDEYREGHVPGAVLIPLGDIVERSDEVPATGEVLIICKMGGRSRRAAEHLRTLGIDAVNVGGGTMAWIEAGHRAVPGDEPGA